jgi:NAD(P)H-hydrate epimerase
VDDARFSARLITPGWASTLLPARSPDTHKKAVGVLLVVAGRPGMAGAAVLAARAALRAGAGLVRVVSAAENRVVLQTAVPAAVFVSAEDAVAVQEALADSSAVAAGPGLGRDAWAGDLVRRVLEGGDGPLLLDADALNLVADGGLPSLGEIASGRPLLITPHLGEMTRLFPGSATSLRSGRIPVASALAEDTRCVLLLKGSPSLVASSGRPVLLDSVGSSDLAKGGVGDVLTGAAGAFLAQGLPPRTAAALALHATGRAARRAGRGRGLLPDDIVEHLPGALAEAGEGETDLGIDGVLFDQDPAH